MLHLIKNLSDQFFDLLLEDPVRPTIPHEKRVGDNKDIFVLQGEDNTVKAITCVSYQKSVPTTESELFEDCDIPSVAVFYTIWSYAPGAGRNLIFDAVDYIKSTMPNIERFVTLSPPTDMARRFHLNNGAQVHQTNVETVNYEYKKI